MTSEDKELLLKELSSRYPYEIILHFDVKVGQDDEPLYSIRKNGNTYLINDAYYLEEVKPYLRSMKSMTDEEKEEFWAAIDKDMGILESNLDAPILFEYKSRYYKGKLEHYEIDFLISHHFDYRGLIEKGLAIEALEGMYK
jgi:hypothetical protein